MTILSLKNTLLVWVLSTSLAYAGAELTPASSLSKQEPAAVANDNHSFGNESNHIYVPMPIYNARYLQVMKNNYPSSMCRITCFSHGNHNQYNAAVGNAIFVQGYAMVPGYYDSNRGCHPYGFETTDISKSPDFVSLCKIFVKNCKVDSKNPCWAGGNP